jgi:hypothetical protein
MVVYEADFARGYITLFTSVTSWWRDLPWLVLGRRVVSDVAILVGGMLGQHFTWLSLVFISNDHGQLIDRAFRATLDIYCWRKVYITFTYNL